MDIKQFESTFQFIGSSITNLKSSNGIRTIRDESSLTHEIDTSYEITHCDEIEDDFVGILVLNITIKLKEQKTKGKRLLINVQIEGVFKANKALGKDGFVNMLRINGTASLFSIARAFIMSLTSQMLLDGKVVIPLVNFYQMEEKSTNSDTQ